MNTVAPDTTGNVIAKAINVAVVGGGITGLAAAYRLISSATPNHRIQVSVFESSSSLGGIISTRHESGCTFEDGPDSFVTLKPAAIELCRKLGLENLIVTTNARHRRAFVAWKNKLEPIPEGFNMIAPTRFDKLFSSNLFSRTGKLRIAIEQFLPPAERQEDESVASFVRRRFGDEALKRIGQPMLGGIYTADPENLSLRATVPKYLDYEQQYGSVTKGLLSEQAKLKSDQKPAHAGARYSAFVSFNRGLSVLVDSLVASIGANNIFTKSKVTEIKYAEKNKQWSLRLNSGKTESFDHVILATPSFVSAKLLEPVDKDLANDLNQIKYASSVVLNFLFDREQIKHPLDGFGFVVPAAERRQIIAGSFNSVKFSNRCPENQVIIRAFMGGAMQEDILEDDDQTIAQSALRDLSTYIKIEGAPISTLIKRYPHSMPQYKLNHHLLRDQLLANVQKHQGLHLGGAYLSGVGIPDCIASANAACASVFQSLNLSVSG